MIGNLANLILLTCLATSSAAFGQGRCLHAYGTPACNTDPGRPIFARTGWRTTALDHITFRVADPQKEAAFYAALMGWRIARVDGEQVVMDVGDWGTVIFRREAASTFPAVASGSSTATPVRAVVEGVGFDIAPWSATVVETELRERGLNPVQDNDGRGFESFHVKDPDGFDVQLSNGQGNTKRRGRTKTSPSLPTSIEPTGWRTVWLDHLSFRVSDYKRSVSFYANLLGWQPTYDEGSQNELMIAGIGDIIIRGGNPLDPRFGSGAAGEVGLIDHISFGIVPWNTDRVRVELEKRGLAPRVDTADSGEIGSAPYKSYHVTTPNGYNLQISYITRNRRLILATAVQPKPQGK